MRCVGTVVRGIRTPIIKENDDLANIVVDSLIKASKNEGFSFKDKSIVAITEAVVGISEGNYVTVNDIKEDIERKFEVKEIGLVYPILSRNRFSLILKGIARAMDKITILLSFPSDEVGNGILDESLLEKYGYNVTNIITDSEYEKLFSSYVHPFTGINMVKYYKELIEKENCKVEFVFSNNPKDILKYEKNILTCDIHSRYKTKKILETNGANKIYGLYEIMSSAINNSGCNPTYGLLGSNKSTEERLKLFPKTGEELVLKIQKILKTNYKWIIFFICLILFLAIAEDVFTKELIRGDTIGYELVNTYLIRDSLTPFAKIITWFGSPICLILITILLFVLIKNKKIGLLITINLVAITILNQLLKFILQRPRPEEFRVINETGYSFPSGHSMISAAVYGLLIYLIYKNIKNKHQKNRP